MLLVRKETGSLENRGRRKSNAARREEASSLGAFTLHRVLSFVLTSSRGKARPLLKLDP